VKLTGEDVSRYSNKIELEYRKYIKSGPRTDPWGIPPARQSQSEY